MDPEPPTGSALPGPAGEPPVPGWLGQLLAWSVIDFTPRHRQPAWPRLLVATAVAVAASLGTGELAVHLTTSLVPATARFSHFRFSDYASLTVVGVLTACASWPVVTWVSSMPRRLFFRAAVAATLVLWLPDGWLLVKGETAAGVATLMVMHLVIALVSYNALVRVAPVRPGAPLAETGTIPRRALGEDAVRHVWSAMAGLVALELVLGVASIVSVPFHRPDTILPARSTWLYAAHGGIGIVLGLGAAGVLVLSILAGRMARIGAVLGGVGVMVGLAGGVLATVQVTRLLGMVVMMAGVVVAALGYLIPALESMGRAEMAKAQAARAAMQDGNEARDAVTGQRTFAGEARLPGDGGGEQD